MKVRSWLVIRSSSRFGLSDDEWTEAKQQLRGAILVAAYDRRMTTYGDVAVQLDAVHLEPYSALMNHLLGSIWADEYAAGGPAITAIVTHKHGDKEPGRGFYEMARDLGYQFTDGVVFWGEQVGRVFKAYGRPERAGPSAPNPSAGGRSARSDSMAGQGIVGSSPTRPAEPSS